MGNISKEEYLSNFINTDFDFDMQTPEGNDMVKEIISEVLNKMFYSNLQSRKKITNLIQHRIDTAYSDKSNKYREIKDTEPKSHIVEQINKAVNEIGLGYRISRFDLK